MMKGGKIAKENFNKTKKLAFEFCNYAILSQAQLKLQVHRELKSLGYKSKIRDGYVFARGKLPVMLVAHLDTVHKDVPCNIWFSANYNQIKADEGIGGDDRCGVFTIMHILKNTELRPNILFVEDEEIGSIGSGTFIQHYNKDNLDLDFIIEIDRKGRVDSVYYDLDNDDFVNYIDGFGFTKDWGSFTDICKLCPHFGVAGVNLSSGYYNPHTKEEYVVVSEMMDTRNKVVEILKQYTLAENVRNKFEWKEKTYTYSYGYGSYYYDDNYYYGRNWVKNYNKQHDPKKTNPYYVDPNTSTENNIVEAVQDLEWDTDLEDEYAHYESTCPYCGRTGMGRDDDYDCFCCDECAKAFGMGICKVCGNYTLEDTCERCRELIKIQEYHDHDDI